MKKQQKRSYSIQTFVKFYIKHYMILALIKLQ